jgi:hypothetical protein
MIDHINKFIFVRMAKCASTSMMVNLFCNSIKGDISNCGVTTKNLKNDEGEYSDQYTNLVQNIEELYRENLDNGWSHDPNHIPLEHIKKNLDTEIFATYFKFAFVRNPYTRLVSAFNYSNWWYNKFRPEGLTKRHKTFKEFVKFENINGKYGLQLKWTHGCDFIGRYENLHNDYNIICTKLNLLNKTLVKSNESYKRDKHYTEYYDNDTREIVEERYAEDIQYFGYKFGEP